MKTMAFAKRPMASRSIVLSSIKDRSETPMATGHHSEAACAFGPLAFQPVAGLEDPPHHSEADRQEQDGHGEAQSHAHIGHSEETPAEAADQIDHRIEQRHLLPKWREHVDGIEGTTEEGERRDDEQRHDLQPLEAVSPDAEHEAEQTESGRRQHEEGEHEQRVLDADRHEEAGGGEDDQADDDRFGRRGADIADDDL